MKLSGKKEEGGGGRGSKIRRLLQGSGVWLFCFHASVYDASTQGTTGSEFELLTAFAPSSAIAGPVREAHTHTPHGSSSCYSKIKVWRKIIRFSCLRP